MRTYFLERLGVKDLPAKNPDKDSKFVCVGILVYAPSEEEARALAAIPARIPEGSKVMPDNTLEPPPPYAWCVDEDPAAWLDTAKTSCLCVSTLSQTDGPPVVSTRHFREINT